MIIDAIASPAPSASWGANIATSDPKGFMRPCSLAYLEMHFGISVC